MYIYLIFNTIIRQKSENRMTTDSTLLCYYSWMQEV